MRWWVWVLFWKLGMVVLAEKTQPLVLSKAALMISTGKPSISVHNASNPLFTRNIFRSFQTPTFLDRCFFCKQELLPGNDIYMYKGDKGFCSVECRCRQIFMDEESIQKDYFSLAAVKPSSSLSSNTFRSCKTNKNKVGRFAF